MCNMSQSVAHLSSRLRPPCPLRHAPIDPFEKISQLRRRDRHRPIRRRGPDEAPALQPLGKQAQPLAVVPQNLDQTAATATEHEQMPAVRIALERLLNQKSQAIKTLAHVGVAGRQPYLRAARGRYHRRRRLACASAVTIALTVEASAAPQIRIRVPVANSISMTPAATGVDIAPASGAIATGANVNAAGAGPHS